MDFVSSFDAIVKVSHSLFGFPLENQLDEGPIVLQEVLQAYQAVPGVSR